MITGDCGIAKYTGCAVTGRNRSKTIACSYLATAADRVETGTLVEVDPYYTHSYGKCVPELVQIDRNYRAFLYGGDK